jgi:hypothetical protein
VAGQATTPSDHPVTYDVEPRLTDRNRATVAFRPVLAIPHALLVGGPGPSLLFGGFSRVNVGPGGGALGLAALVMAVISWVAVLFTGRQPRGLWDFAHFYLRWRSKAIAYMALLRDEYPPFGDGDYPVRFETNQFPEERNRWSVGLRPILVIPHVILLVLLLIVWLISAIVAWFAIVVTGRYPDGLYNLAVGYMRWTLRLEAYGLLIHDQFPPFRFEN